MRTNRIVCVLECLLILVSFVPLETSAYIPKARTAVASSIIVTRDSQGINVTLTNMFELYFNASSGGEITRYYDLVADPNRLNNLVLSAGDYWKNLTRPGMLPLFSTQIYNPYRGDFASTGKDSNASVTVLGQGVNYVILQSISRVLNQTDSVLPDSNGNPDYVNSTWLIRDDGYIFVERTLSAPTYSTIYSNYRWYPFYLVRSRGFAGNATFYLFNTTYAYTRVVSNYTNDYNSYPAFPSDQNGIFGVAAPFNNTSLGGDGTDNVVIVYDLSKMSGITEWKSDSYIGENGTTLGGTEFGATHEFPSRYSMYTNTLHAMIALTHQSITEQNMTSFADYFSKNQVFPLINSTLKTNKQVFNVEEPLAINVSATANFNLENLTGTLTETNSTGATVSYKNYGAFNFTETQTWLYPLLNETISNSTAAGNYTYTFRLTSSLGTMLTSSDETIQILSNQFGKTTVGGATSTSYANFTMVCRYLMPTSGIVTSISIWFGSTGFDARVAIYTHPTGILLVQSQSKPVTSEGWNNFTIPPTFLLSGFYGLAWKNSQNAIVVNDPGESKQTARTPEPFGNFSNIFGPPEFFDMAESIYATYKPVAAKVGALRYPQTPNYDENVTIIADLKGEASNVGLVTLSYSIDALEWVNATMLLNEGSFTATIPQQKYNTTVYYKVYAFDVYGVFLGDSDVSSYTVADSHPPVISYLDRVPSSPNYNDTVTMYAGVTEPVNASGVELVILDYWNGSAWTNMTMTLEGTHYVATVPSLPYGTTVNYTIWAFDYAGNVASMGVYSYTVADRYLPIARIDAPAYGSYVAGQTAVTVFANDTNLNWAELRINGTLMASWSSSGQHVLNWASANWTDGVYLLNLTVTDKAGNVAITQVEVTVDNTSPLAAITAPESESYLKGIVPISVTGNDSNFLRMELYVPGGAVEQWDRYGSEVYYWRTTDYPDGNYFIKLVVYDKALNKDEKQIFVTIDNTQPTASVSVSTIDGYIKGTVPVNLTGDDANFDRMDLKIDDATKQTWTTNGTQSYGWDTSSYSDGFHHVFLTVYDKAGNVGETEAEVTLDNTPPTIGTPVWQPAEPAVNRMVNLTVKVTDSPSDSSIKNVTLWYKDVASTEWQPVQMTFANGEWTATIPGQATTTTIDFYVQSFDKVGNSAESLIFQYNVVKPSDLIFVLIIAFTVISASVLVLLAGTATYLRRRRKSLGSQKAKDSVSSANDSSFSVGLL